MTSDDSYNKKNNNDSEAMMLAFAIETPGAKEGKVMHIPKPNLDGPGFALIRVLRAGVCNTDLEILQGYMGFTGVLGHEFVGVVEEVHDDQDRPWIGKRVCGDINVGCHNCGVCHDTQQKFSQRRGCSQISRNHCPNRTVLGILKRNGTMAEFLTLPIRNLHEVPKDMSDQVAVFSEPLAAACRIPEQGLISYATPHPDQVAILGDGKLGLMIAEVLGREHVRHFTANSDYAAPILFGKHAHKLELVASSGVQRKFVSECQDSNAYNGVHADYAGKFDVVVDATGSPAGLTLAAALCRPMGTLILKSTCAAGEQFNAAPFVIDELRVIGSRCGPIDKALQLLHLDSTVENENSERVPSQSTTTTTTMTEPLQVVKYITKCFPLSQADQAIQCAAEKSTMKVQIICSGS
jgi:alcohol dehydrogenase